jgi:hypothetical protein
LTTATLIGVFAGVLPALAADSQLLSLVPSDAKVLAGVNVAQAKTSPMGQYVLSQMQIQTNPHLLEITARTGFDPTRDVQEVLVASSGEKSGLLLARGNFDPGRIAAVVTAERGLSETYNGVTILTDPQGQGGFAFLSTTIAVAGDVASVKSAIDRQRTSSALPAAVAVRVNQWSTSQDAWVLTTVPPTSLRPNPGLPPIPGLGAGTQGQNNAFTGIQQASAGLKFGTNVALTVEALAANPQDATQIGDTVKLLASLAQMQANADPNLLALTQSLTVNTNGGLLNLGVSLPQERLVELIKQGGPKRPVQRQLHKKM